MQNSISKYLFMTSVLASLCTQSIAQDDNSKANRDNTPYARYGIGTLADIPNATLRGMGGGGTGFNDPFIINSANPASYSYLKATTYTGGFDVKNRSVSFKGKTPTSSFTGNMSYLTIATPIKNIGGLSIGFQPVSNSFYQQADTINILDDRMGRFFSGKGGLNKAFLGLAFHYKGLSLGANIGYTFGFIKNASLLAPRANTGSRSIESSKNSTYGGFVWDAGIMYQKTFKKGYYLNTGLTYRNSQSINGKKDTYVIAQTAMSSSNQDVLINRDTISALEGVNGQLSLPSELGFGLHFGKKNSWEVIIDSRTAAWSNFKNFGLSDSVSNSWSASIGGSYTPDINELYKLRGRYFSAVTYRLGFYTRKDYVSLRNTNINEYAGSFGMSFPLKRRAGTNQLGSINTALNVGQRGTHTNGLAREVFVKFSISASLSDIWYIKPKYD